MNEFRQPFHTKPGAKSSEFWLAVVVVVASLLTAFDARPARTDPTNAVAIVAAALTAYGYSRGRAQVKSGR